jgi:hypothetical protein
VLLDVVPEAGEEYLLEGFAPVHMLGVLVAVRYQDLLRHNSQRVALVIEKVSKEGTVLSVTIDIFHGLCNLASTLLRSITESSGISPQNMQTAMTCCFLHCVQDGPNLMT